MNCVGEPKRHFLCSILWNRLGQVNPCNEEASTLLRSSLNDLIGQWLVLQGISRSFGLDFVVLSYDDHGVIICRKVGDSSGMTRSGSICWTAKAGHGMFAPLPDSERHIFELRQHVLASTSEPRIHGVGVISDDFFNEEVVEMLWATVEVQPELIYNANVEDVTQIRVWQYASGRFGFGNGPDGRIVDFRPVCTKDNLVDVVELRSGLI